MNNSEFNFNATEVPTDENNRPPKPMHTVFRFDMRILALWLLTKWKWITLVFCISLILFWAIIKYLGTYGNSAWTAEAKVFHQTRSEKVPSFYKPVETNTVMQFIASRDVAARVTKKLKNSIEKLDGAMLDNIQISTDKTKKNMIIVSASSNSPQNAALIANAVAEEGISEYVRRQNNSLQVMSEERKSQRDEIEREIAQLEADAEKFTSPVTGLPPDIELSKLREEISMLTSKRDEMVIRIQGIDARRKTTEMTLKETPKNVEFEITVDQTGKLGLEGKRAELTALRERYTDANPKVKVLAAEIALLEKTQKKEDSQPPQKITYRKNSTYAELEYQLANIKIDELSSKVLREKYDYERKSKREKISELLEKNKAFTLLNRRIKMLQDKSAKISDNINDIEFIIGSAVPDVYLFESAKTPSSSNIRKARIKVAAFSLFTTLVFITCMAAYKISRMKITSSKEYAIALGVEDLGEIPERKSVSSDEYEASIQKLRRNIVQAAKGGKRFAVFDFDKPPASDGGDVLAEILNLSAINGKTSFRLKCLPLSQKPEKEFKASPDDKIAESLISVVKMIDRGFFYFQNGYCLDVAECDLLKFDLGILAKNFDIITIEAVCGENSGLLASQLAREANFCLISAKFETTSKFELAENIEQVKANSETKIGGFLTDSVKPYYKA